MSGFDHSAFAAQASGGIEYLAGDLRFTFPGVTESFGALVEAIPTPTKIVLEGNRRGKVVLVALTIPAAVFAGKRPDEGQSFRDSSGRNYRIQEVNGGPTDAVWRFICGSVLSLTAPATA